MSRRPLPPLAAVVGFIDCINRGDVDGLASLMHETHRLEVLDEQPLIGRDANISAWRSYLSAFPDYVIYPRHLSESGQHVAVLGTTTGSHLGMPDSEERELDVIWMSHVEQGTLTLWAVREADEENRASAGFGHLT